MFNSKAMISLQFEGYVVLVMVSLVVGVQDLLWCGGGGLWLHCVSDARVLVNV